MSSGRGADAPSGGFEPSATQQLNLQLTCAGTQPSYGSAIDEELVAHGDVEGKRVQATGMHVAMVNDSSGHIQDNDNGPAGTASAAPAAEAASALDAEEAELDAFLAERAADNSEAGLEDLLDDVSVAAAPMRRSLDSDASGALGSHNLKYQAEQCAHGTFDNVAMPQDRICDYGGQKLGNYCCSQL